MQKLLVFGLTQYTAIIQSACEAAGFLPFFEETCDEQMHDTFTLVLADCKDRERLAKIKSSVSDRVRIIAAVDSNEAAEAALSHGADDFIILPLSSIILKNRLMTASKSITEGCDFPNAFTQMPAKGTDILGDIIYESGIGICISDLETYETFYVNELGQEFAMRRGNRSKDYRNRKCYEYFMQGELPCKNCKRYDISADECREELRYDEQTDRYFSVKSKIVKWNGRDAFVEYQQDVTERRRYQSMLEKSERQLDTIINTIPIGIAVLSKIDGQIFVEKINDRLLGYADGKCDSFIGLDILQTLKAFDRSTEESVMPVLEELFREHRVARTIRLSFGESNIWVNVSGVCLSRGNGVVTAYVTFSNVTNQKNNEDAIRSQAEYLQKLYDSLPCAVAQNEIVADEFQNCFIYINGKGKRIFEYDSEKGMLAKLHPDDLMKIREVKRKLAALGDSAQIVSRIIRKNGSIGWLEGTISRIKGADGNEVFQSVFDDVTESRMLLDELKKSESSLTAAIRHSGLDYWEYNFAEDKVTFYSDEIGMPNRQGLGIKELVDTAVETGYLHPDDCDRVKRLTQLVLEGKPYTVCDYRVIDKVKGEYAWKRMRYSVLRDSSDKPYFAIATSQDIDEYKELGERFKRTLEQNGLWVWDYDIQGHSINNYITDGVDCLVNPFGDKTETVDNVPESVISRGTIHPDDVEKYRDVYRRLENGEKRVSAEVRLMSHDTKQYSWNRMSYTVLPHTKGNSPHAVGSSLDISVRKSAEQRYMEELKYREQIASTMLATTRINLTRGIIEEMNFRGKSILTDERRTMVNYSDRIAVYLTDIELSEEKMESLSAEGLSDLYERGIRSVSEDFLARLSETGELVCIHADCKLLESPITGDIIAFTYNKDITNEYCMRETIDAILRVDYDLAGVIFANSNSTHSFSKNKNTVLPQLYNNDYDGSINEFVYKNIVNENKDEIIHSMRLSTVTEQLKKMPLYTVEFDLLEDDNTVRRKEVRYTYADRKNGIIIVSRRDINDIVVAEIEKQKELETAKSAAEKANNAKTEFLSHMSHEMRTPMNAIMILTKIAADACDRDTEVFDCLSKIDFSGKHLLSLINDVLDMAKIESGEFALNLQPYKFGSFKAEIDAIISPLCREKNISFKEKIDDVGCYVLADGMRLGQVIMNLLSNAVKFTPAGGRIEFICKSVKKDGKLVADMTVTDSGIGMSEEFQTHMFEPFAQESSEVTTATQGTGLGLPIAQSIVHKMGGTLTAKSKIGKGTSFFVHIELPITESGDEKMFDEEYKNGVLLKGMRILLVEDHPMNTLVATKLLTKIGAEVVSEDNGQKGLERFGSSDIGYFDAVLMDIRMPVMDGLTAAREIRKLGRDDAKTIPIIAMTANAFASDVKNSEQAGMNAHLSKPINPDLLYSTLAKLMKNK